MDNKKSHEMFNVYQGIIPSDAPISLLDVEILDAPVFYHPIVKTKEVLCVYGLNHVPSQIIPIINEEGFNEKCYIRFNSTDIPVQYLHSWVKIQIKSDNWFDFVWSFEQGVTLMNLEKTKCLFIYRFFPTYAGEVKQGDYGIFEKRVIYRIKKKDCTGCK